jgi:uncharacterized membrane protein
MPDMAVTSATPPVAEEPRATTLSPAAEQRAVIGLLVGYVVCFALLGVGIDDAFGLPAHPLLLHVPVVLIPLLVLATIALVARPQWRERHALGWGTLAVVALAGTVLTAGAGDKLIEEQRFIPSVLHEHQDAGETLRILMFVFVGLILVTIVRDWRARRGAPIGGAAIGIALSVLVVLLAAASGFFVVRAGHLGSKATWGHESRQGGGNEEGEGGP